MMSVRVPPESVAMPTHHPHDELLVDYAAGACGEGEGLFVATHLALCPSCRTQMDVFEHIGGSLLEDLAPEPMSMGSLEAVMAMIETGESAPEPARAPRAAAQADRGLPLLPRPLRDYVTGDLSALAWRPAMRGVDSVSLPVADPRMRARLMRIRDGVAVPMHTHAGSEMTLVLAGGFTDEHGQYLRGDCAISDHEVTHRPVADLGEDCLCLVVTDAPLKLTGRFSRLLNPLLRRF
jgi:putative transcriptional regulator